MSGYKIVGAGNAITYGGANVVSGKSRGILTILTQIPSAIPSFGDKMFWDGGGPDYGFIVNSGTYAGGYPVNRNNTIGENIWRTAAINSGLMRMVDWYDYQHWINDQRFGITITNNSSDDHYIQLKVLAMGGISPVTYTSNAMSGIFDPFSGGIDYYANGPGSTGAWDPGAVNTGWTMQITVINVTQNMPSILNVDVSDYHTRNSIYNSNGPLFPPNTWTLQDTWNQRYYSAFNCIIDIS